MTTDQLIIALGGLILSVLTYFAGVIRTEKRYSKQDKSNRINEVLNKYMEFRKISRTAGWDGLLKSGVATLNSDAEIRAVADKIAAHGEKDPLARHHYDLNNVNLKILFDYAVKNNVNFHRTSIEEVIAQSGA